MSITFGILTVSDSCYKDNSKDASGPQTQRLVTDPETETGAILRGRICCQEIVPDEEHVIMKTLLKWADSENINVILTTGGTGFSKRDVTPEATRRVIEKEAPGIVLAMLKNSLKITPMAMLSRAICGIRGETLIVNLPGSPKAVQECLSFIAPVIPHAVALILDERSKVQKDHENIQESGKSIGHSDKHRNLAILLEDVANRPRESPYPMISLEKAKEILLEEIANNRTLASEQRMMMVPLEESRGRILAESIRSPCNLPPFRASIKDGYAVIMRDGAGVRRVRGAIEAGQAPFSIPLHSGECMRINTGGAIPDGATAVVQIEDTRVISQTTPRSGTGTEEATVEILRAPSFDQDIRNIGCDVEKGDLILRERTCIGAAEMGILAACGIARVPVFKQPIVGILSTGNELQAPGETALPGHVYDSNKITLMATLKDNGYDSVDLGIVQDDAQAMIARIEKALSMVDVLITTGSVSMGDKDMLKHILKEIFEATIHFGRVNLKPGKPTTFATCEYANRKKYLLCLPGNPVSAMVTAHLFAIPLLHGLSNNDSMPTIVVAEMMESYSLDPRPEYVRAILEWDTGDIPKANITGYQISSRLLSCRSANAFLMLPGKSQERSTIAAGDRVSAMLIGFEKRGF